MSLPNCFSRIASLRSIGNAREVLIIALLLASVTGMAPVARATEADGANDVVEFNRDVRPILADKCFHCHGPDSATREAGLRLDREESAKEARDGGAAIVAGKPDDSELVRRIRATSDEQMPPADSGRSLSAAERRTLERWISAGAAWERHWSFVPPRRPKLPSTKRTDWIRNPIDAFVLATLERQGLGPSPPAGRMRLLRRVTFDLTGLPPTMEEMDRFLADSSPLAYERAVDRLLASPAWGEHWALEWLEAARYADTDGYQNDGPRDMWRWRDWVIEAYDRDLPFDQFTIEQLAGDLLPDATMSQRLATGFNRNHRYNSEAGLVQEEFLLENAVDRVDTTMAVWQGLTFGCARCHNHKYDPLTQQDYYGVIDLFNDVSESGRAVKFGNSEPVMLAPTTGQAEQWAQLDQRRENAERAWQAAIEDLRVEDLPRSAQSELEEYAALVPAGMQASHSFDVADAHAEPPIASEEDGEADGEAEGEADGQKASDRKKRAKGKQRDTDIGKGNGKGNGKVSEPSERPSVRGNRPGAVGEALALDGVQAVSLGKLGDIQCQTRSSISFFVRLDQPRATGVVLSRQDDNTRRPGFTVELHEGKLRYYIITRWIAGVAAIETAEPLPAGQWVHVALTNDGSQFARGMRIYVNGQLQAVDVLLNTNSNTGGTSPRSELRAGGGVVGEKFAGAIDELRFYNRTLWDDEILALSCQDTSTQILATPASQRTAAQRARLAHWAAAQPAAPELGKLFAARQAARQAWLAMRDKLPTAMVMDDAAPRPSEIRLRGVYHQHGERVAPGAPQALSRGQATVASRLDFARWLVGEENPLTARVVVNRIWQHHFGAGLVRTAEDFGFQGELPTHPELLDWLAVELRESGWSVKRMARLIVTSSTYRQDSAMPAEDAARDPRNRLLGRGPRQRLSAQAIRDQALAVSGLLVSRRGGASTTPYQPANLWKEMSNMTYRQSHGAELYRRSLYTFWKRTVAPPGLAVLDAADRENCTVRPHRTNTPLQALTLLNDVTYVEAARHLAARMLRERGDDPAEFGFRLVTGRHPEEHERKSLHEAVAKFSAFYEGHHEQAEQLLGVGESARDKRLEVTTHAAWTALANALLNLDEAITRQ